MALKKDDIIKFMTRDPQVHVMEILGYGEFDPEKIEKEEYAGRIKAVIDDGESFLLTTLSPFEGFICIADAEDVIRKVNPEELSSSELSEYNDRYERFESPNTFINAPLGLSADASTEDKCKLAVERAIMTLFPDTYIHTIKMDEVGFYTHEAFTARLNRFIGLVPDGHRKSEMTKIKKELVGQVSKARFKEYYEVTVIVKEDDMALISWTVAIDKNFEEVSIMRNAKERGAFMYSLGPEYYDLVDACNRFRRKCIGKEERI